MKVLEFFNFISNAASRQKAKERLYIWSRSHKQDGIHSDMIKTLNLKYSI